MFVDLNAPRFNKRKYRENIVSKELYEEWKESTGYRQDFSFFKQVWAKIAEKIIQKTLEERDGVRLGGSIGDLYVGIIPKTKRRPIDYKLSKELGQIVYHENWNTNGKLGKIIYGTNGRPAMYRLCKYWWFIPNTRFKEHCVQKLRENPERYKHSIERKYNINEHNNKGSANQ